MQKKYLTSKCNHNQRGRCINCLSNKLHQQKSNKPAQNKSNHNQQKQKKTIPNNLCNHSKKVKCINCLSSQQSTIRKCKHGPLQKCQICIQKQSYNSFKYYFQKLKLDCPHKKPCDRCVPPQSLNYFINKNCKNHIPYPQAMCNLCIPPTVSILKQNYTHVKQLIINTFDLNILATPQLKHFFGILYGKIQGQIIEVKEIFFPRHVVDQKTEMIQIFTDQFQQKIQILSQALNLEPVGILFDSIDLYHHHILLSTKYQQIYKSFEQNFQISKFVTLRIKRHPQSFICQGIQCYMISDQFQSFQKNNLIYPIPNSNQFGLQICMNKSNDLPTYLRNGIQIDKINFEQIMVWVKIQSRAMELENMLRYPYFNKQIQTIKNMENYFQVQKTIKPILKYKNFQFLLQIIRQINLQLAINLSICQKQDEIEELEKILWQNIAKLRSQQLLGNVLNKQKINMMFQQKL